jgi:DNA polymerase-3 subunit beta
VETDSVHSKILTVSAKDFPLIPKIKKEKSIKIQTQDFQNTLQKAAIASSVSKIKPELNGVFVSYAAKESLCTFAATDTFRLAEEKVFIQKSTSNDFSCILPIRTVQELIHYQTNEKEAELIYGDSQVKILFGEQEIISNIASGIFPNYNGIIPKNFTTTVEIEKDAFVDAIRSASFFSSKLQDVRMNIESSEAMEIHAENSDVGETTVTLSAKIQGKPVSISFNHKFLLDGVQALSGTTVILSINTETSPALLKSADNSMYQYLIMPIKGL